VKEYLSRKGIPFTDYNVGTDRERAKEMIQKSGTMAVPVILVDDQVVVGFNELKLEALLK
jgi:glutaredoxin